MNHKTKDQLTTEQEFDQMIGDMKTSGRYYVVEAKLEIAERLYLAMQRAKINNSQLAERLKTSKAYITKILQGDVNFTIETLCNIAHALDCRLSLPDFAPKEGTILEEQKASAALKGKTLNQRFVISGYEQVDTTLSNDEAIDDAKIPSAA